MSSKRTKVNEVEEAGITILFGQNETTIEFHDRRTMRTFARAVLNPEQVSQAFSRLSYTHCKIEVFDTEHLNQYQVNEMFEFEIPETLAYAKGTGALNQKCLRALNAAGKIDEGWSPDIYYGSQGSFFTRDGKHYARAIIRRWLPLGEKPENKTFGT